MNPEGILEEEYGPKRQLEVPSGRDFDLDHTETDV